MDAAKDAINKLTSKHGHHETDVTEHYNPAVTHETIAPTREHRDTTVVDNEVHQDHHHTTVLPVTHKEVLPTEHHHQLGAAKHTEHHHGDHEGIKAKVAAEAAQFTDKSQTIQTEKTHTVAPSIGSEHHHHHVHETIQPVVQKQTVQPSVVHTTIPVHEVHHNEPKHYTASALPAVSMEEFTKQGGSLKGLADRTERFEGEPESIARGTGHHGSHGHHHGTETAAAGAATGAATGHHHHDHHNTTSSTGATSGLASSTGTHGTTGATSGLTSSTGTHGTTGATSGLTGSHGTSGVSGETSRAQQAINERDGLNSKTGAGIGAGSAATGAGIGSGSHNTSSGLSHSDSRDSTGKPSLIDRLNPFKDADGDGKKGVGS